MVNAILDSKFYNKLLNELLTIIIACIEAEQYAFEKSLKFSLAPFKNTITFPSNL